MILSDQNCPLCKSSRNTTIYSSSNHPFFAGVKKEPYSEILFFPLTVKQCLECSFVFSQTSPDASIQIDKFYKSAVSMTSAPIDKSEHTSKIADRFILFLKNNFPLKPGIKVLEIGCREGFIMSQLRREFGIDITGIDISGTETITDELGPLKKIKDYFPSSKITGKFDLIYSKAVLEHVPDLNSFLSGISQRLRPGGIFVCQVPNTEKSLLQGNIGIFIFEHVNFFTPHSLSFACQKNNLTPTKILTDNASLTVVCHLGQDKKNASSELQLYNSSQFTNSLLKFKNIISSEKELSFFGASPDLFNHLYTVIGNHQTNYSIYDNDGFKSGQYFGLNTSPIKKPDTIKGEIVVMPITYSEEITAQIKNLNPQAEIIRLWN